MKKKILFLLSALIFLLNSQIKAQDIVQIKSPQVADFMKYGNTSVTKNTGRLDFSIELLSISEKNFSLPISLGYNSSGFMPAKHEGLVGLNWFLNVGGVITREVNGIPDDLEIESTFQIKGLLHVIKDNKAYGYTDSDVSAFTPSKVMFVLGSGVFRDTKIEIDPDVYSFNFCGYSGKFIIGYDGNVKVTSNYPGVFKVDLSGYEFNKGATKNSTIKIIADNGYTYSFGGNDGALEYSIELENLTDSPLLRAEKTPVSSFHLSKIEAPNGSILYIDYEKLSYPDITLTQQFPAQKQFFLYTRQYVRTFSHTLTNQNGYWGIQSGIQNKLSGSLTKIARIKTIRTDFQTMEFSYSDKQNIYDDPKLPITSYSHCGSKLDKITLKNKNNNEIKTVAFNYENLGGTYPRLFLTQLTINNLIYKFSYYKTDNLPAATTESTDYWGFWNGKAKGAAPTPSFFINSNGEVVYTSNENEVSNLGLFDVAMLKQVTFPTGCTLLVEYEENNYSERMDQTKQTNWLLSPLKRSGVAGGARVKLLTENDGTKSIKRAFQYTKNDGSNESSGLLYNWPKYYKYTYTATETGAALTPDSYYSSSSFNVHTYEQDHIQYSVVKETKVENIENLLNKEYVYGQSPLTSTTQGTTFNINVPYPIIASFDASMAYPGTNKNCTFNLYKNGKLVETFVVNNTTSIADKKFLLETGNYRMDFEVTSNTGFTSKMYLFERPVKYAGPYVVSYFSNYNTNPNTLSKVKNFNYTWEIDFLNYFGKMGDKSLQRGKLVKEENYLSNGVLLSEEINEYSDNTLNGKEGYGYKCILANIYGGNAYHMQAYNIPLYSYNLKKKQLKINNVDGKNPLVTSTEYIYNKENLTKEISTTNSDGSAYKTEYKYPSDFATTAPYNEMVSKNILSPVVQEMEYKNSDMTNFIKKTINNYSKFHNLFYAVGNQQLQNGNSQPLDTRAAYTYDPKGSLRQVTASDADKVVYLWSYNYQYPIAEIKGTTFDEVKAALGYTQDSQVETLAAQIAPDVNGASIGAKLRTYFANKPVEVSTYTYKPLVGMLTSTDARGVITSFDYDSFGRLITVKNHNGNIVKNYLYNYKNK